jgi:hypothetical protein
MTALSFVAAVVAVLMMIVRGSRARYRLRAGARRRPANCATTSSATSPRTNPRIVRNQFIRDDLSTPAEGQPIVVASPPAVNVSTLRTPADDASSYF